MDLAFKIVKVHDATDEVLARIDNYEICKAAFERALFVYPKGAPRDAPGSADHFEIRKGRPQVINCEGYYLTHITSYRALNWRSGSHTTKDSPVIFVFAPFDFVIMAVTVFPAS